jgi:predicted nucleic acid-binding protein
MNDKLTISTIVTDAANELDQLFRQRHRHEIIADLVAANKQRDELAAALRSLIHAVEFEGVKVDQVNAIGKARAVLAKVQP